MKAKTKALITVLCAALLVVTTVFVTVAFLTSTDSVTNTFTVGKVTLTLDEAKVDENGNVIQGAARVKTNSYKLIPGHTYTKDPTVHFGAGSEASWIFIKVDNPFSDTEGVHFDPVVIDGTSYLLIDQITEKYGWTQLYINDRPVEGIYYRSADANTGTTDIDYVVFSKFKIAESADADSFTLLENARITITAYAIQKDGFSTPVSAYNQIKEQYFPDVLETDNAGDDMPDNPAEAE